MADDRVSLNRQLDSTAQMQMQMPIQNEISGGYSTAGAGVGATTTATGTAGATASGGGRPPTITLGPGTGTTGTNAEIFAIEDTITESRHGKKVKYRGRSSYVAGAVALIILLLGGTAGLAYYGIQLYQHTQDIQKIASGNTVQSRANSRGVRIADGSIPSPQPAIDAENPLSYENRKCIQPNYIAQNGMIYIDYGPGSNPIPLMIKGVTWRGMETKNGVPEGLSNGKAEGNNLYQIVDYLSRNNFNSIRLALSIDSITRNIIPDANLINSYSHSALDLKSYRTLLSSFIRGLAAQSMTVLLDFHTLTTTDPGKLWYNNNIRINDIQDAITILAKDMCNGIHWNIIGIDLKNAPTQGTWGDKTETDWAQAATTLGNTVLRACPNWLVFVQGVQAKHSFTFGGNQYTYRDFDGAGLQNAMLTPIQLTLPNKVVYAPQFYNPSQTPFFFFYKDGNPSGVLINKFVERDDDSLKQVTIASMNSMFGNVSTTQNTLILSAFGGLYGKTDAHPKKTSTRVLDNIIANFVTQDIKISGGYLWALNPSTSFSYNPADIADNFEFALVDKTWRKANMELLAALKVMDTAPGLGQVKCMRGG